jgi:acyl dehydratase
MDALAAEGLETSLEGLKRQEPQSLGHTDWTEITQQQVNQFAELTGDRNFLHIDPQRARETMFGGTIAHGLLSLSLLAPVTQRLRVTDASASINYGYERVRFPAPLPVGARWRATANIVQIAEVDGGVQVRLETKLEVEGVERPAVAAECLVRFYA